MSGICRNGVVESMIEDDRPICPTCRGSGAIARWAGPNEYKPTLCPLCKGEKHIEGDGGI